MPNLDVTSCKIIGRLLAGAEPSPGVLTSLKEAVDEAAAALPETLLNEEPWNRADAPEFSVVQVFPTGVRRWTGKATHRRTED